MLILNSDELLSYVRVIEHDSLNFRVLDYCPSEKIANCIVWMHGIGGRLENWFVLLENLSQTHKYRHIAFDLRGHGQSTVPKNKYNVPTYIADLEMILVELGVDSPFFLVSHSITGIIAFAFALQFPEKVQGIISISFAGKLPSLIHKGLKLLPPTLFWGPLRKLAKKELPKYALSRSSDKTIAEETVKYALKTKNRPVNKSLRALIPFSKNLKLGEISKPVFIITGKEDKAVCPEDLIKQCSDEIPNAKLKIFDNASHLVHLEWPTQVSRLIHEFIAEIS